MKKAMTMVAACMAEEDKTKPAQGVDEEEEIGALLAYMKAIENNRCSASILGR